MKSTLAIRATTTFFVAAASAVPVSAQVAPAPAAADTVTLGALQAAALRHDPREAQLELIRKRTEVRLGSIAADHLPTVEVQARGQYQSDVISIPFDPPGEAGPPMPPHDTYDASLFVRQSLYDPSIPARRRVEMARGEEAGSEVETSLYSLKERVNEAFFGVMSVRTQAEGVEAAAAAIEGHLQVAIARTAERTALPSEEATLRRELLRHRQRLEELNTRESVLREQLELLTGVSIAADTELKLPELPLAAAALLEGVGDRRARPEYERFDRVRSLLERQDDALAARRLPTISAFGRGGYGRPGLNPLATRFDAYWLAGVQVDWAPWQRGTLEAERQELAIEREILDTREAAFTRELENAVIDQTAVIAQLEEALARDEQIVALSEEIAAETRLRFAEGVTTSAELVEDEAELLRARLDRSAHRIGLSRARARLLTIIGYELP